MYKSNLRKNLFYSIFIFIMKLNYRNMNDFKYKSFNKNYLQNIYKKSKQLKGKKSLVL